MRDNFYNPNPSVIDTDLKLWRYWNLRGIVDATSNSTVAEILGKKTSYITTISGPNPLRAIGDDLALEIETKFKLPVGGMDAKPDRRISNDDPMIADVARMMSMATQLDKMLITDITKRICGHSIKIVKAMESPEGTRIFSAEQLSSRNSDISC